VRRCPHCGKRIVVEVTVAVRAPAVARPRPTREEREARRAREGAEAVRWTIEQQRRQAFRAYWQAKTDAAAKW
jgi:sarcosine oxidase delta subunit